jgi:hypothetical protein
LPAGPFRDFLLAVFVIFILLFGALFLIWKKCLSLFYSLKGRDIPVNLTALDPGLGDVFDFRRDFRRVRAWNSFSSLGCRAGIRQGGGRAGVTGLAANRILRHERGGRLRNAAKRSAFRE